MAFSHSRYVSTLLTRGASLYSQPLLLPATFRQAGYKSACFGDLQLPEGLSDSGFDSLQRDADYRAMLQAQRPDVVPLLSDPCGKSIPEDCTFNTYAANNACTYLREALNTPEPFLCVVGFRRAAGPAFVPAKYLARYGVAEMTARLDEQIACGAVAGQPRDIALNELITAFASYTEIDNHIGRILQTLSQNDQAQNTIVVFTALAGSPLQTAQPCEANFRVPLIIAGPKDLVIPGTLNESPIESIDVVPALVEMAGLTPSKVAGKSIVPLLRKETPTHRQAAMTEFPQGRAIRTDHFTYCALPGGTEQLIDHAKNPPTGLDVSQDLTYRGVLSEHRHRLLTRVLQTLPPTRLT